MIYGWGGFHPPIGDTGGASPAVFRAGSTIPVLFNLTDASGRFIEPGSRPKWLTPVRGTLTHQGLKFNAVSRGKGRGDEFFWDGSAWHYNWKTRKDQGGYYWRVGVELDDGERHEAWILLR